MNDQMSIFDILVEQVKEEPKPIPKPKTFEEMPSCFDEYIGLCDYCYWNGYGITERTGFRASVEGLHCQWEDQKVQINKCRNRKGWRPNADLIPRLCGNCIHSNEFHYYIMRNGQKDWEHDGTPVEDKDIYCTRDEGSENRQRPFKEYCETYYGDTIWHRNHEWDTCDAWQSDGVTLRRDEA